MPNKWTPNSWRSLPIKQQPTYENQAQLKKTENQLANLPPLVSIDEIEKLKSELEQVAKGEAFLLQGGDCAESFNEFSHENLKGFFRTIMQMTIALMYGLKQPVVKVGRVAGQYAKPRSLPDETIDGNTLPAYRGDIVNSIEFEKNAREANPQRLIDSYFYSAASLNYLRSLALGGYGNLEKVNRWNEEFAHSLSSKKHTEEVISKINENLDFMRACGLNSKTIPQLTTASFFTSHEALLLNYEEAFTRKNKERSKFYDLSAHMLWIGDRTRHPDEAHVEFMRGIANPIAFKISPSIAKDELLHLLSVLNPENEAGRITLISRMGAAKVEEFLPPLVEVVKAAGAQVIWSCDPMHGNTIKSSTNYKTRKFDDILSEIKSFFSIHQSLGTYPGGVHLEMTGQDVTECLGGNQRISELGLQDRYHTHCDPRLNASQSVELAFMIARELSK
ncbi:MAG: 3-deoxy-7-phosphoheptulonate synthase class II [Alphaproteobacteria bacterium]|nr:3-deoxy-7-phosphoheptulonate synthase class II [Alphaproteobacteria bacterium]